MKTRSLAAFAHIVILCSYVSMHNISAKELAVEFDTPPRNASSEERQVGQAELDECCFILLEEKRLLAQRSPAEIKNAGSVTHIPKYGYILRFSRVESVSVPNGETGDVYSTVVMFTRDGETVHTVIDYREDE